MRARAYDDGSSVSSGNQASKKNGLPLLVTPRRTKYKKWVPQSQKFSRHTRGWMRCIHPAMVREPVWESLVGSSDQVKCLVMNNRLRTPFIFILKQKETTDFDVTSSTAVISHDFFRVFELLIPQQERRSAVLNFYSSFRAQYELNKPPAINYEV